MGEKIKSLFSGENRTKILNLIYSVGAAVIFNMVIQLVLYPGFERHMGAERYGVALAIISVLAITAGSFGYAVNCARLLGVEKGYTDSGNYNLILLGMGVIGTVIGVVYLFILDLATPLSLILYALLMFSTMLRYYSEVEYRMSTNFFRYMIYYILISVGYIVGLFVFKWTDEWMLALILGETAAVVYVIISGTIYRPPFFKPTKHMLPVILSVGFVLMSSLIDNVTLHADRILLLAITGDGEAVTTYYIASLIGKIVSMLTLPINAILLSYLVRYQGGLTKKLWSVVIAVAVGFGAVAFLGCMIVSPWLIGKLYPDQLEEVRAYLAPAILGQIFYFVSGVLMIVLLRFKGEKKQLIFNGGYAVIFFGSVAAGTVLDGLNGFIVSILIANGIRFLGAVVWGLIGRKKPTTEPET
ncbi:MAG: hypothetical protein IKA76_00480 [Clostridia bacterium]|nr:hypothetical protein [Clostridia bacterium]